MQSFVFAVGDAPEPEELIKAMVDLENSASSDAVVRERIANLPPEVSEVAMLAKLEDKVSATKLAAQVSAEYFDNSLKFSNNNILFVKVNEAAQILHEYNSRLSAEMEDRKKLTTMLKDFQAEQRELLAQAEQRHKVCFKYNTYNKYLVFLMHHSIFDDLHDSMNTIMLLHITGVQCEAN